MKFLNLLIVISLTIFSGCKALPETKTKQRTKSEFQHILDEAGVKGSILILDDRNETYYSNNFETSNIGHLPASTYKIPHSIIGLETGILSDSTIFKWDKKPRAYKSWEQDLSLKQAFQYSCVPCYQELAGKIGVDAMIKHLQKLDYPTMEVTKASLRNFWLVGDSKISTQAQIQFLKRLYEHTLPISPATQHSIKDILHIKTLPTYSISGKTGLAVLSDSYIGWFVGYIETKEGSVYFATCIMPGDKATSQKEIAKQRKKVTMAALRSLEIIH